MAIYLGDNGHIELARVGVNVPLHGTLDPADVNVAQRRFSFDFGLTQLITGDRVQIRRVQPSPVPTPPDPLDFIDGNTDPDFTRWIHVDDIGGIRLYNSFEEAYAGKVDTAIELSDSFTAYDIELQVQRDEYRCVSQITEYTISTSRETMDLTVLGQEHRRQYADGLIQGQGSFTCFWDYKKDMCDPLIDMEAEEPNYIARLVNRTQIGALFVGRFYLFCSDAKAVWYDAACILTNVSFAFDPTTPIRMQAEFVTTGPFVLQVGEPTSNLLLDPDAFRLMQSSVAPTPSPGTVLLTGP